MSEDENARTPWSVFRSGAAARISAAAIYAALAFAIVLWVEHPRAGASPAELDNAPSEPSASVTHSNPRSEGNRVSISIEVTSIQPISEWSVFLDGREIPAAFASAHVFEARVDDARPRSELAVAADCEAEPNALRVRITADRTQLERTIWCTRDCFAVIKLRELSAAARPGN